MTDRIAEYEGGQQARLERGAGGGQRTAWIITFTPAADEPRVVRQAQALMTAGWQVVVCGYDGRCLRPPDWHFVRLSNAGYSSGRAIQRDGFRRRFGHSIAKTGIVPGVAARLIYNSLPNWRLDAAEIVRIAAANRDLTPSLVIAHDNQTCPPAAELARRYGAKVIVDSHEYMLGALPEEPAWVKHQRPFIKVMQDHYFTRADQVVTVSDGIAERLTAEHNLKRPARVIRSMPFFEPLDFRPTGPLRTVLYHGIVTPFRNLETAIEAAALWREDTHLVIRGPGEAAYLASLRALVAERNLGQRVRIEAPALYSELLKRANEADIGYFVYADGSPQRRYVLPNKFFEYTMAGLALVTSDLPEMAALLARHGHGRTVARVDPETVRAAIDGLSNAEIDAYKTAALAAARQLCWEREQGRLLSIVEDLCGH
ncbi:MAG: glycosyltransferase [Alphaproteobacteria bacterium]|nr:glycosyltransferase [Alphaproteobacteria bacterium]